MKKLAILGVLVLAVAALAIPVAAAPVINEIVPVDVTVGNPCTGERVHLEGNLHIVGKLTEDSAGGFHGLLKVNAQGISGEGLESGAKYQATGSGKVNFNTKDWESGECTAVLNANLIGQGKVDDLKAHINLHITVNANGDVTAKVKNINITCK